MKNIFLITFFVLSACTSNNNVLKNSEKNIIFFESLSFNEFKNSVIKYANESSFPSIND